ncbi:MAG: DUF3883 domain-containing protein [Anaerolineales bacterium]|nr:DUF3883 domain-containing protein [Anaerolineales bacterium]
MRLEDLAPGVAISGLDPTQSVRLVQVEWRGSAAVEVVYTRADGGTGHQILFRSHEAQLTIEQHLRDWAFDADPVVFTQVAEAYRIHLAHLFDPLLAVNTSLIEPLPHQITAVYEAMLPRQPLRFLLADDPGSGKTIMAGLLIKELMARGAVQRCMICVPGGLAAQWQDELWFKFQLRFDILTRESFESAVTGNAFQEHSLVIARLDQLSRSEALQDQLRRTEWDLVVVDEAHKMSAHYWAGRLEETRRYQLGRLLGATARHLLLMTATPHDGKEEDFQLFLQLLDRDRFEGRFREGVHQADTADLMRRMIKEDLVRFDGRPLFPERRAYTVDYHLAPEEMALYEAVTEYVREEFNRADRLGDDRRRGTVGFALTVLQRRLASSPDAIYHSLRRRRERLSQRLKDVRDLQDPEATLADPGLYATIEQITDLDDAPADEIEAIEEAVMDRATAAATVRELEAEIAILGRLEQMASQVRALGVDQKWQQVAALIQDDEHMFDAEGRRRKLVIFTEHRDTLRYLERRVATLFGRSDNMVHIDGSVPRDARRATEDRFRNDPDVHYLLATDAAAEGINLQRANLMINYDLPWNPNRLEQRFGRIHRIGQTQVCHLWNLVSGETREGHVYQRLLKKLEAESQALQGKVFDVLGTLFEQEPLRKLLIEAIRYGERPDVLARLEQVVDGAVDVDRVRELIEARSLATERMDLTQVFELREEMERYAARRLQPHYIRLFFVSAFQRLGGYLSEREAGRYTISYVPARIRQHAHDMGTIVPVWEKYERVCFEKQLMHVTGVPDADLLCPGHPLLDAVVDLLLQREGGMLRSGAALVDPNDPGRSLRVLYFIEQTVSDGTGAGAEATRAISQQVHFVEVAQNGTVRLGGSAPYLDFRPPTDEEHSAVKAIVSSLDADSQRMERCALDHAIEELIPQHLEEVQSRRQERVRKTRAAVQERLTKEINYWDGQASRFRADERANKPNAAVNRSRAESRADDLAMRLEHRMLQLAQEEHIEASPPVIVGGALVIPVGLLHQPGDLAELLDRRATELVAMKAVMDAERTLGRDPRDVSAQNVGCDVVSVDPGSHAELYLEVKGRRQGATTVMVTRNEILRALNVPERYVLALVEVANDQAVSIGYVRSPFTREPESFTESVVCDLRDLMGRALAPS